VSEHALPEDLSQWPDDPFELLGVERGVAPTNVKRSYTRLIKVYKPERFPEHFRRIREAYESILRHIEYFGRFEFMTPAAEATPTPSTDVPAARPQEAAQEPLPPPADEAVIQPVTPETPETSTASPSIDEIAEFWERAIRGEEAEAYKGLLDLHCARPQNVSIVMRLYWLLSLEPDLDSTRRPADWLVDGLKSSSMHRGLLELYRREIEADPAEAVSTRFDRLLAFWGASSMLADLYAWRWRAIRKLGRWDLMDSDLPLARDRLRDYDQQTWLRLLLLACDAIAWADAESVCDDLWQEVVSELRELSHLALHQGESFDRFDFLVAVRTEWRQVSARKASFPEARALLDLIARAWQAPFEDWRSAAEDLFGHIDRDPEHWFRHFEALMQVSPALLGAFGELLQQYEYRLDEPPPRPSAETIVQLAFKSLGISSGGQFKLRKLLMEFCWRELIDPIWIVEAFARGESPYGGLEAEFLSNVSKDWPLRYICQARRLFWS
jgi:hypothetical protein